MQCYSMVHHRIKNDRAKIQFFTTTEGKKWEKKRKTIGRIETGETINYYDFWVKNAIFQL